MDEHDDSTLPGTREATLQGATLHGATPGGPHSSGLVEPLVPMLTLAAHPDPARIGDRLVLASIALGRPVAVGRLEPRFTAPDGLRQAALDDPFISRRPITFARGPSGGVLVDPTASSTPLRLDGELVTGPVELTADGAVLELGDRVVLVFHHASPANPGAVSQLGLVGVGRGIQTLRREIRRVGPEPIPVLLRGESGTGKELVARALHDSGPNKRPFVSINMAAIPPSTAASELFGHARGAFTGAADAHQGYFGQADGGTLFLDEIGETPNDVQPLLLRALESGEIQPVGGRRTQQVSIRYIAATDANLDLAIREGGFRVALLHRLAGYEVAVPTLRSRREDIGVLLRHFLTDALQSSGDDHRLTARPLREAPWLGGGLVAALCRADWPGNVRELRNMAQRMVVHSRGLPTLQLPPSGLPPSDLRTPAFSAEVGTARAAFSAPTSNPVFSPPPVEAPRRRSPTDLSNIDGAALLDALEANGWKVAASARALGISKNSLYKLMDQHPNLRKASDLGPDDIAAARAATDGGLDAMARHLQVSRRGLQLRMTELGLG